MIEKYLFPALMLMAQAIVLLIGLLKVKSDRGKIKYNPHPPGEAQACRDHKAALARFGEKLEEQGKAIARVEEGQEAQEKRLDRVDRKLNGK